METITWVIICVLCFVIGLILGMYLGGEEPDSYTEDVKERPYNNTLSKK